MDTLHTLNKYLFLLNAFGWGGGGGLQLPVICPKVVFHLKKKNTKYNIISFHYCSNLLKKIFLLTLFYRQGNKFREVLA